MALVRQRAAEVRLCVKREKTQRSVALQRRRKRPVRPGASDKLESLVWVRAGVGVRPGVRVRMLAREERIAGDLAGGGVRAVVAREEMPVLVIILLLRVMPGHRSLDCSKCRLAAVVLSLVSVSKRNGVGPLRTST